MHCKKRINKHVPTQHQEALPCPDFQLPFVGRLERHVRQGSGPPDGGLLPHRSPGQQSSAAHFSGEVVQPEAGFSICHLGNN